MDTYQNTCQNRILNKFENAQSYAELFEKIDNALLQNKTYTIAIDGMCGSGKTFLSEILQEKYNCNIFHADSFFLQKHQRTPQRLGEIGGNLDFERLKLEILDNIHTEKPFEYSHFSCATLSLDKKTTVFPKKLNILEGSYSHSPALNFAFDLKVFICTSNEKQQQRILKRNGEEKLKDYIKFWIPKETAYFEAFNVKENSDLIIQT